MPEKVQVDVVGWHLHPEAGVCKDCDESAHVVVVYVGDYDPFNLCNLCLKNYNVRSDKISEVFEREGF